MTDKIGNSIRSYAWRIASGWMCITLSGNHIWQNSSQEQLREIHQNHIWQNSSQEQLREIHQLWVLRQELNLYAFAMPVQWFYHWAKEIAYKSKGYLEYFLVLMFWVGFLEFIHNKYRNLIPIFKESDWLGVSISFSWGGGCSFKIRPTHRSIDDTSIQPKFVGWLSRVIKSKILCRSIVKVASIYTI